MLPTSLAPGSVKDPDSGEQGRECKAGQEMGSSSLSVCTPMYVCAHSPPTHCSKRKKYTYDSLDLGDKVYPPQLTSMTPGIHLYRRHQPCSVLALHFSSFSGPGLIHLHPMCYGNPPFYPCNTQHLPQLPFEPPL